MSGKFDLRLALVLSCFLLMVVESGTTQYPPDLPPVVVVYNKTVTDGETIQVNTTTTRDVDIECTVEGGSPAVTNVTLTCDGSSKTVIGYSGVFTLTFGSSSKNVSCTCSADHVTGLYFNKTSFTFSTGFLLMVVESGTTQYPPDLPPVVVVYNKTVTDGETIQVNTTTTRDVDIECTVEGGSPAVTNVTLTCDGSSKTISGYRVFFTLTIGNSSPNVTCTCSADHVTGLYFNKTSFTFSTGFLFVVVESGSLIASFTVNDQSTQVSVNVGGLLTFQGSRVENITNPSWKVVGRYTGTSVLSGGTFTSKSFTVAVPATCAYNDIFDCTATLGGQTETLSVRVNVNNCAGTTAKTAASGKNSGITVNASILTLVATLAYVTLHSV